MSIELGILAAMILLTAVGFVWLHRSSRLARLMDPGPRPEDDCPCRFCTDERLRLAERKGGTDE